MNLTEIIIAVSIILFYIILRTWILPRFGINPRRFKDPCQVDQCKKKKTIKTDPVNNKEK